MTPIPMPKYPVAPGHGVGNPSHASRIVSPKKPGAGKKHATDPNTGLPVMKSEAQIRAEANAEAWKSISQMQSALPSDADILARYGARRAAVQPLIDAHRQWLQNAGTYQVQMTNALGAGATRAATAADDQQTGFAAAAGAPMGTMIPTNVSGGNVAIPAVASGVSQANYFNNLNNYGLPDAIGSTQLNQINQDETGALTDADSARAQIAAQLPQLKSTTFSNLYGSYLDRYKSELAALAAGDKTTLAAAKQNETNRHNRENEAIARDRNATSQQRADAATKLTASKLKAAGKSNQSEVNSFRSVLDKTLKIYNDQGGTKGSSWSGILEQPGVKPYPGGVTPAPHRKVFYGTSQQDVLNQEKKWELAHPPASSGPQKGTGGWIPKGAITAGGATTTGRYGETTRRLNAWRYLVAQNALSTHPLGEAELRTAFRRMVGAPG